MSYLLDHFGWEITYAIAKRDGKDPKAAVQAANGGPGAYTLTGDLLLRAHDLVTLLERWRDASKSQKAKLRKGIRERVPVLYPDLCAKHQEWVHGAVRHMCAPGARGYGYKTWDGNISCFYEVLQKDILKTGCADCAIQKLL